MSISLEYTRPTLGKDRIIHIPEMNIVAKAGKISENGNFKFDTLNGGCGGSYEAETNSVYIRSEHKIRPVTILYLDTEKMPPDLKSEWYL